MRKPMWVGQNPLADPVQDMDRTTLLASLRESRIWRRQAAAAQAAMVARFAELYDHLDDTDDPDETAWGPRVLYGEQLVPGGA